MKFREHRGSFAESLETVVVFHTFADFMRYLTVKWPILLISNLNVEIKPYAYDSRKGWGDTWIVTADRLGVLGFTDGPVPKDFPG